MPARSEAHTVERYTTRKANKRSSTYTQACKRNCVFDKP